MKWGCKAMELNVAFEGTEVRLRTACTSGVAIRAKPRPQPKA